MVTTIFGFKILIINSVINENYEQLPKVSFKFVKEAESALNLFMKASLSKKENESFYFDIKNAKTKMFKILTSIVTLITNIIYLLQDDKISKMNRDSFIRGLDKLQYLREDYIYILRN